MAGSQERGGQPSRNGSSWLVSDLWLEGADWSVAALARWSLTDPKGPVTELVNDDK